MTNPQSANNTKRPYRTEAQWRQLIEDYEASDVSIDNFCAQNNLNCKSFYQWRKRLQQTQHSPGTVPDFIELTHVAKPSATQQSHWDLELEFGSGTFLRIRRR
jgi:transposase-like protein